MVDIVATKDLTEERRRKLADELVAWFQDNIGLPTDALFYDIAAKALGELQAKAQTALKQSVIDDATKRKLRASERGLIYSYEGSANRNYELLWIPICLNPTIHRVQTIVLVHELY